MRFFSVVWSFIVKGLLMLWLLFKEWISIFISPIHNLDILWIIVPIWINLIFTDHFQESKGTKMGNAITNGAITMWVGIDWLRYLTRLYNGFDKDFILGLSISIIVIFFGLFIVIKGIKGKKYIRYIARVRETSYLLLVFSPVIYGIIKLDLYFLISIVLFFPLFYYLFEFLNKEIPVIEEEVKEEFEELKR